MTIPAARHPALAPVVLVTYSTKPRGGVVHTLHLGEALQAAGTEVRIVTLGDPDEGFYRPTTVPCTILPAPRPAPTLAERVFDAIAALTAGLGDALPAGTALVHVQDCIAARAGVAVCRPAGIPVLRTVHHIDDFTTPELVECQERSVLDPDHLLVVSRYWQRRLAAEFAVDADVVTNGVDVGRFARPPVDPAALRARVAPDGRFVFLTVGGVEPRKGSRELFEALAAVRDRTQGPPVLAIVGGHSFQDHRPYRDAALARAAELGLRLGEDIVVLGMVSDEELAGWYHAADAFAFPSVKEGWGMVVLEAMAAGLPVVTSDIPVFREYLEHDRTALLARAGDAGSLATALQRLVGDPALRRRLAAAGRGLATRYTWAACAGQHQAVYERVLTARAAATAGAAVGDPASLG